MSIAIANRKNRCDFGALRFWALRVRWGQWDCNFEPDPLTGRCCGWKMHDWPGAFPHVANTCNFFVDRDPSLHLAHVSPAKMRRYCSDAGQNAHAQAPKIKSNLPFCFKVIIWKPSNHVTAKKKRQTWESQRGIMSCNCIFLKEEHSYCNCNDK